MKGHHPFLPYLPFFVIIPLIFPYLDSGIGFAKPVRVVPFLVGRDKGPEGKSSWKKLKSKIKLLRCVTQGFPKKK
jgi:hypothetical protein